MITLALPAYNEASIIVEVVTQSMVALRELGEPWELILIDNASTDDTPKLITKLAESHPELRLIVHESNRLYSGSCATAIREARGDRVIIMDSDGQHTARDIPRLLAKLDEGASLVIGWRRNRNDPLPRLMSSKLFNAFGKIFLRYPYHDLNCGYRAFDRRFQTGVKIVHRINLANPELYTRAKQLHLPVAEVEVSHFMRAGGKSSHNFLKSVALLKVVYNHFRCLRAELSDGH
jgi:glycosyltransferase involved in cell wall biosynthesis